VAEWKGKLEQERQERKKRKEVTDHSYLEYLSLNGIDEGDRVRKSKKCRTATLMDFNWRLKFSQAEVTELDLRLAKLRGDENRIGTAKKSYTEAHRLERLWASKSRKADLSFKRSSRMMSDNPNNNH
jgi:hypothetical protein